MKMYRMTMDVWVADDAGSPEDWIIQAIDDNLDHRVQPVCRPKRMVFRLNRKEFAPG